jgi:hypothetical protein
MECYNATQFQILEHKMEMMVGKESSISILEFYGKKTKYTGSSTYNQLPIWLVGRGCNFLD